MGNVDEAFNAGTGEMELLSPAGSFEGLKAAVSAGADAVYLGGDRFGARAYARNFSPEELLAAIDYVHLRGKRLYLTVNTLLKNTELKDVVPYLEPLYEQGLDAVLVQDFGVLKRIHEAFPDLPIHASTQMTVTGSRGMNFLSQFGVTRVVPARELSLEELTQMHQESPLEIETFVHGALCYSISGMCLHSSLIGGRSGNRGRCAQPCRLNYEAGPVKGKKKQAYGNKEARPDMTKPCCLLSMKDLCGIDLLPELMAAGVSSLKIEGRMKQPAYTAGVTAVYRKYLDLLKEAGPRQYRVDPKDRQELLAVFSRGGSCEGYYHQHNGKNMIFFTGSEKIAGEYGTPPAEKKLPVSGRLYLRMDEPVSLELWRGDQKEKAVVITGKPAQHAQNHPLSKEELTERIGKMGDTPFCPESLQIDMEGDLFIPVGELNALRRQAIRALTETLLKPWRRTAGSGNSRIREGVSVTDPAQNKKRMRQRMSCYVSCETALQAEAALQKPYVTGLYLPFSLFDSFWKKCREAEKEIYLALPYVVRQTDAAFLAGIEEKLSDLVRRGTDGFLVRNLEGYALLQRLGFADFCVLDHSVYTFNDDAVSFWRERGVKRMTAPLELNEGELGHRDNPDSEMLIYGYLPTMISCQCVKKNTDACSGGNELVGFLDRQSTRFWAQCCCDPWYVKARPSSGCYNVIYNSLPLGLFQEHSKVTALGMKAVRLSFTMEDKNETERVLREYESSFLNPEKAKTEQPAGNPAALSRRQTVYTKGHFKRGVE